MNGPRVRICLLVSTLAAALAPAAARAQDPPEAEPLPPLPIVSPPRPTFQVAMGLGASMDRNAPNPKPDRPVPSFFFTAGLGGGPFGFDLRSFANGATAMQVTRLSLEAVFVLRPLEPHFRNAAGYAARVLRAASLDLGPAAERVAFGPYSARRYGLLLGAHLDLPIAEEGAPKELRVRLGVRRLRAGSATVGDIPVTDSRFELYAQIAVVF